MKYEVVIFPTDFGGSGWSWQIWQPIPGGKVLVTSANGYFPTRKLASKGYRAFRRAVASAPIRIDRNKVEISSGRNPPSRQPERRSRLKTGGKFF